MTTLLNPLSRYQTIDTVLLDIERLIIHAQLTDSRVQINCVISRMVISSNTESRHQNRLLGAKDKMTNDNDNITLPYLFCVLFK